MVIAEGAGALGPLIRAVSTLHAAGVTGLDPFDPLTRIRPRLVGGDAPWMSDWIARHMPPPSAPGLVHGDFHAGQLIRDRQGAVWILDLDDLALGPPEADIGNFAAHLATRPETRRGHPIAGFGDWLGGIVAHYSGADHDLADRYGRIALLRRGLKLAEAGDDTVLDALRAG